MTYQYVPGAGYTVRHPSGRVIGHGLTLRQRDALLALKHMTIIPTSLLLSAIQTQ